MTLKTQTKGTKPFTRTQPMSTKQIEEISNLLLEYSAGNYEYQGSISDDVNELDMIISGINMLGEELLTTNVSRDYFSSIFNAVTDLVLILDEYGKVTDCNRSTKEALGIDPQKENINIDDLLHNSRQFLKIQKSLEAGLKSIVLEADLKGVDQKIISGLFTCSSILDRFGNFNGYLLSIKDISQQKENEKLILKTIFTTQQNEQKRVADDLHDSLGQELSMTKLMISNLRAVAGSDPKTAELIGTCSEILDQSITHLREICFNLMPSVLMRGGLNLALSDLVKKLEVQDNLSIEFEPNPKVGRMDEGLEIVMYRIAQEFINNMIKHAKASLLTIELKIDEQEISLLLKDNGVGFDMDRLNKIGENRGYQNLQSKVKAFNGDLEMKSVIGEGTSTHVKFPIIPHNEKD